MGNKFWHKYTKTGHIEARPYEPGEDLEGISVSPEDDPSVGDMIARDPENHEDQWLIDEEYFEEHYLPSRKDSSASNQSNTTGPRRPY